MSKPHILITNDDGIHADGIRHLFESLKEIADITVVAPSSEKSAVGLGLTIRNPLNIEKFFWNDQTVWGVNGTPADCVKLALNVICRKKPDLVVSGINHGSNAGRNILYSGTVGGTIEAVFHDIPGIAFSCHDFDAPDFASAGKLVPHVVEHFLARPLAAGTLLNVNFPPKEFKGIKGFKMVRQGMRFWQEDLKPTHHPDEGGADYWLGAKWTDHHEEDSDILWLNEGYMTAVPIHVAELTDLRELSAHKSHFETLFEKHF